MTFGSATRLNSCCLDKFIAKTSKFLNTVDSNEVLQTPIHPKNCRTWVAMSKRGIIGFFCFKNKNKNSHTITKGQYIVLLYVVFKSVFSRKMVIWSWICNFLKSFNVLKFLILSFLYHCCLVINILNLDCAQCI